jgi:hypothetical protein
MHREVVTLPPHLKKVVTRSCIGRCTLAVPLKYSSRTVFVEIFNTTGVVRCIDYSSHAI